MLTTTTTHQDMGPSSTVTTTVRLLNRFGRILLWFAPILFAGMLVTYLLVGYFGGSVSVSIWEGIGASAPYGFLCAMAIALTYIYLPLHVAHGGTRRGFMTAIALMVACAALLLAVMVQVGYLLESFVYAQYGWTQALDHQHLFHGPRQAGRLLLEYTLGFTFSGTLGVMAAATYYRLGNVWATVLLAIIVFTPIALQRLFIDPWVDTSSLPFSVQLLLWLVFVVLSVVITYLMVRRVALRSKSE